MKKNKRRRRILQALVKFRGAKLSHLKCCAARKSGSSVLSNIYIYTRSSVVFITQSASLLYLLKHPPPHSTFYCYVEITFPTHIVSLMLRLARAHNSNPIAARVISRHCRLSILRVLKSRHRGKKKVFFLARNFTVSYFFGIFFSCHDRKLPLIKSRGAIFFFRFGSKDQKYVGVTRFNQCSVESRVWFNPCYSES